MPLRGQDLRDHGGGPNIARAVLRCTAACTALVMVLAGCGSSHKIFHNGGGGSSGGSSSPSSVSGAAFGLQRAFVDVVARVRPEVVQITAKTSAGTDLGSGIVYDTKGYIVTNDHVVGTARHFAVQLFNGKAYRANLVGSYPPDDLAVIKISGAQDLRPATFGNSASIKIGDIVMAVGNPLGLSSSVTEGIVSYNGRTVAEQDGVVLPSTIQTSAPINPGNSGGALVDLQGRVIGIPTLAATDQQYGGTAPGIGFAIPSNIVTSIASQLISKGKVTNSNRAALGITANDAVTGFGGSAGALIRTVDPGSGAARAGLRKGDVIVGCDGRQVADLPSLQECLAVKKPGQTAHIAYKTPNGSMRKTTVHLGQLPSG